MAGWHAPVAGNVFEWGCRCLNTHSRALVLYCRAFSTGTTPGCIRVSIETFLSAGLTRVCHRPFRVFHV